MIEIDDVFEARIAVGFRMLRRSWKTLRLASSCSTIDLDHEIAGFRRRQRL
ncbi:MAG: hypothetical protein R3C16_12405 [Hyphomonadaceae bacterium]